MYILYQKMKITITFIILVLFSTSINAKYKHKTNSKEIINNVIERYIKAYTLFPNYFFPYRLKRDFVYTKHHKQSDWFNIKEDIKYFLNDPIIYEKYKDTLKNSIKKQLEEYAEYRFNIKNYQLLKELNNRSPNIYSLFNDLNHHLSINFKRHYPNKLKYFYGKNNSEVTDEPFFKDFFQYFSNSPHFLYITTHLKSLLLRNEKVIKEDIVWALKQYRKTLIKFLKKSLSNKLYNIEKLSPNNRLFDMYVHEYINSMTSNKNNGKWILFVKWMSQERWYPNKFDTENLKFIQEFSCGDYQTANYLSRKLYQEAIWKLRRINCKQQAKKLEKWLYKKINEKNILEIKNLGGGVSTTKLVVFKYGISGVYKPKEKMRISSNSFHTLIGPLATNYKKEVGSYLFDHKLLETNFVPLTKKLTIDGNIGSLQYFVKDTFNATELMTLGKIRIKPFKKGPQSKKAFPPQNMVFLDWLISNKDRNLDNFLYSSQDNFIVGIDHGITHVDHILFKRQFPWFKKIVPSRRIVKNVYKLLDSKKKVYSTLKENLTITQINVIWKKLKYFAKQMKYYKKIYPKTIKKLLDKADNQEKSYIVYR